MSIFMTFRINWFKNYNYKSPISELKLLFIKLINNFFNGVYYILTYYDEDIGGLIKEHTIANKDAISIYSSDSSSSETPDCIEGDDKDIEGDDKDIEGDDKDIEGDDKDIEGDEEIECNVGIEGNVGNEDIEGDSKDSSDEIQTVIEQKSDDIDNESESESDDRYNSDKEITNKYFKKMKVL